MNCVSKAFIANLQKHFCLHFPFPAAKIIELQSRDTKQKSSCVKWHQHAHCRKLPRCARCCADVLSTQQSPRAAHRSVASGFHSSQEVFFATFPRLGQHMWLEGNAPQFLHNRDLLTSNFVGLFFYFFSRAIEGEH